MHGGSKLGGADLARLVADAAPAAARPPRLSIWHGHADTTVSVRNARALALQCASLHARPEQPDETLRRSGLTRSVWRSSNGEALVKMNLIAGLGHGVPIAGGGDDPAGIAAPFILEAGISSSFEIARFWGIAPRPGTRSSGKTGGSLRIWRPTLWSPKACRSR